MTVTKVVVLILRILEQLSLYFSDFTTIFYAFLKFVVLKFKHILQISPWRFWFFSNKVPGWDSEQGREGRADFRRGPAPAAWARVGKK